MVPNCRNIQLYYGEYGTKYRRFGYCDLDISATVHAALDAGQNFIDISKGVSASQLAIAWLLAQSDDIVSIPGTKGRTNPAENMAAADIELSAD